MSVKSVFRESYIQSLHKRENMYVRTYFQYCLRFNNNKEKELQLSLYDRIKFKYTKFRNLFLS
jgi:hypothetical protein